MPSREMTVPLCFFPHIYCAEILLYPYIYLEK